MTESLGPQLKQKLIERAASIGNDRENIAFRRVRKFENRYFTNWLTDIKPEAVVQNQKTNDVLYVGTQEACQAFLKGMYTADSSDGALWYDCFLKFTTDRQLKHARDYIQKRKVELLSGMKPPYLEVAQNELAYIESLLEKTENGDDNT